MDMQRLSQALKAAHAAGDTAAATKLAQEIRNLQQPTQNQNQQQSNEQQSNKVPYLQGLVVNAPVRGWIGMRQGFDARKAASAAKEAEFYDVSPLENMKRAAASRMNPQIYQKIFESEEGIEYLQYLAGQNFTPTQMLERIQKRNPELGTDFSENGWAGQVNSIFNRYEADKQSRVNEAYDEGEEALSNLAQREANKANYPMSDIATEGANIYAEAPSVMEWAKGAFEDPLASLAFISEIATESAPAIGAGIGTAIITRNPKAAAGVMVLAGAPRTYSGEFVEFLRSQDVDVSDPYAIKAAISNDEILAEANKRGFTKAAIVGFFEALGMKAGGNILTQGLVQGATGSGGELVSDVALDGVENIDWKEVVLEGIAELATTPAEYSIIKGKGLFKNGKLSGSEDLSLLPEFEKLAAADVARLLDEVSKANGYKLKNVDPSSSQGAKQALEDVRSSNVQAINDLKKVLKKQLDPKNAQSLEQLLSVFSPATAGIAAGKKKVSQKVTTDQLDALSQLVGNTKEGQQLLQELVKSNVITDLFKGGMKGGVSQFTDLFNPLSHSGAVYDPTRYANVFVGGASAYGTGGASLGVAAGGRVVDFFTGRRSKVAKFVKSNKKALGLPDAEGTSIIEQKAKQKAAAKDRRAAIAQIATILDAPKAGFVENILLGTGLDRSGLETVLNNMASDFGSNPDFTALLDDIQKNLDGEGVAYLDNLSEIIPVIGTYAQAYNPELVTNTPDNPLLKRSFDSPNVQTDMPNMGGGSSQFGEQLTTPENYRRGIQDNLDFVRTLQDSAGKDKNLTKVDRGRLITSLENLTNNLGSNPVETVQTEVQKLQEQGVNQDAIDTYVKPYVDRVVRQQRPKPRLSMEPTVPEQPNVDADRGINVRTDGNTNYANLIVSGEKTYETRDSDSLRPYVGKRVGIVETGSGKAKLVGYATIGEPIKVGEAEFDNLRDKHLVPKGSKFDIKKGGQKYLYPTSNPVALDTPVDASANKGIVARRLNEQSPILNREQNPLNIDQNDLQATNVDIMPTSEELAAMKDETKKYKPELKRTLVEAANFLNERWQKATGRKEPFEYTPENVDRISSLMATEAMQALKNDNNAIGWYDRKLKAAKAVVSLVDPRVTQSPDAEAAFDFALAVTSNGQAVADNFEYALEVFRHFMDNGVMPTNTWIKGGERNEGMVQAFEFFNSYNASGANMPIQEFLDSDYTVKELEDYISRFNTQYGTNIGVPSSEGKGVTVKGSYIIGPKIGQGFYQNIRGNYDPLTMDIWWMRMWNRLTGRPFETSKDLSKNRTAVRNALKPKKDAAGKPFRDKLEKRLTNQTLKELGIKRSDLKNDETLDTFVSKLESNYQSFFRKRSKELKGTGKKVEKPQLFKSTGTMVKNMVPQLQGQPKSTSERQYMREVTQAAIEKLRQNGYMIDTADFQALMWYPEKQLFRKLGVAPGRGADNDYLDAAIMLAEKEGFTNDQINQALPSSDGDGAINSQSGAEGSTSRVSPRLSQLSQEPTGSAGILFRNSSQSAASRRPRSDDRNIVPNTSEVKQAAKPVKALIEIGSPDGQFPDGIKDIEGVRRLAEATNITIDMYINQDDMIRRMGLDPNEVRALGGYNDGIAYVLADGSARQTTSGDTIDFISKFDEYITTLHEVFHGVNDQLYNPEVLANMDSEARARMEGRIAQGRDMGTNKVTGRKEIVSTGSFDSFIAGLTTGKTKVPNNIRKKMLAEMLDLQKNGYFRSQSGSVTPIRDKRAMETNPDFKRYVRNAPETAVDVIMYYAHDPKRMKREYPNLAKMVKGFFSQSSKVQFFSHPLAMAIAVVYAMLLKQEQADEEELQQGILAQQQAMQAGALTA